MNGIADMFRENADITQKSPIYSKKPISIPRATKKPPPITKEAAAYLLIETELNERRNSSQIVKILVQKEQVPDLSAK